MKTVRTKNPKIIQLAEKLAAIIVKREKRINKNSITFMVLLNLNISKRARDDSPIKPKKIARSFQPPKRLEVGAVKILTGIMFIPKSV